MTHTRHVVGLIALLLVGLYVVTAYAATGPSSITDNSSALTVKDFEPGDSGFVQAIKVVEDNDGDDLQVNSITIKNSASAPLADAGDIDKIEIYRADDNACTTNVDLSGSTTDIAAFNSASGVTVSLTANNTVPNNSTRYFCVKIITKSGLTPGRNIKSRFLSASGIDPDTGISFPWLGGTPGEGSQFVTKASGFKVVADATPSGQKSVAPGGQVFAQIIKVADETASAPDFNTLSVTVNSITIDNLGTATPADVASIQIFNCGTASDCSGSPSLMGTSTVSSFPVTIPLVASNTFADDSTERYIGVRVTVSSTPGHTFRLRSTLNVTENPSVGSVTTGNIDVPTGRETIIEVAGFETVADCSAFTPPAALTPGDTGKVVQCITLTDSDANTNGLTIKQIQIQQLGSALGNPDIDKIEYGTCNNDGSGFTQKGFQNAPFTFPVTIDGTDVSVSDNGTENICVRVDINASAVAGRTINFTSNLTVTEGSSPDLIQSRSMPSTVNIASGIGCEVLTDSNIGPATIASGTTGTIVQTVTCTDSDGNTAGITVNSITVGQLGTAVPGDDITKIEVDGPSSACDGTKTLTSADTFPVTFNFAGCTIGDNDSGAFAIKVDVSSTIGRTIQTQVTLNVTEAGQTITQGPVNDGTPSTIIAGANKGCEAVTDLNVNAGSIPSGTSAIVQRLVCADSDGDSSTVLITQVNVRNLGDAVGGPGGDVNKIEIVRMDTNAVVGSTTNTANFATSTGVNIPVSVTVPDDGSVELGVRVYVTSTPGRTIQLRTTLRMFEGGVGPFLKSADDGTPETIAAPAACPTVVQGAPAVGQIGVFQATPATLTFTNAGPDGTGQLKTIRVRVQNRSSIDITVEDITEQLGEIVVVEGVTPILPRTVRKNTSVTFFVKVRGPDVGPFPQTATRPYVDVNINCGGPTATQPARKLALPLEVKEIRAEQRGELLSFRVLGSGVQELGVQLFSLSGQLIADHRTSGATLTVPALTAQGQRLAKGVYLYVVTVRGWDGQVIRSEIRKIVVK
jgi:hypothetical protein